METHQQTVRGCVECEFKSYYVVWKLHKTDNKNITQAKFKSYYVVWKPRERHIGRIFDMV